MKKTLLILLMMPILSFSIVIHNPNGVAVWFESQVGSASSEVNYDSIATKKIDSLLNIAIENGNAQFKNKDTVVVIDSTTAYLLDSLINVFNKAILTKDTITHNKLDILKDSISATNNILRNQLQQNNLSTNISQQLITAGNSVNLLANSIKSFQIIYNSIGGAQYQIQIGATPIVTFTNYNYPEIKANNNSYFNQVITINCVTGTILLITQQ